MHRIGQSTKSQVARGPQSPHLKPGRNTSPVSREESLNIKFWIWAENINGIENSLGPVST